MECEDCKEHGKPVNGMCKCDIETLVEGKSIPNIVINITYNDNRLGKDECTYVDNVTMLDSEEE